MASAEKTILVVDDSANDVDLLKRAFKGVGIRNPTQVVYSAEDAICYLVGEGRFKDRKIYAFPVLVLLDLKMPGTDGFEVLRWVRGRESMKHLIIVLTNSDLIEDIRRAYLLGANSFLTKPLPVDELNEMVRSFHNYWIVRNRTVAD